MNTPDSLNIALLEPRERPKAQLLLDACSAAANNSQAIAQRYQTAEEIRYCLWAGQSPTGKKEGKRLGALPFPWEGASDARVRVAEEIIIESVVVLLTATMRAHVSILPRQMGNMAGAQALQLALNYYLGTAMRQELRNEIAYLADWRQTYGIALLEIGWHVERRLVIRSLTRGGLMQWAIEKSKSEAVSLLQEGYAEEFAAAEQTGEQPAIPEDVARAVLTETAAANNSQSIAQRYQTAEEIRYCLWAGQSPTGKKEGKRLGALPFPWEGASDARVRVAEEIIIESVVVLLTATMRAHVSILPRQMGNMAGAQALQLALNYYLGTAMRQELRNEIAYLADWRQTYGIALLEIGWHVERRLVIRSLTRGGLMQWAIEKSKSEAVSLLQEGYAEEFAAAEQTGEQPAIPEDVARAVLTETAAAATAPLRDKQRNDELAAMLVEYDSEILFSEAKRLARQLRSAADDADLEYHAADVIESRPKWIALQLLVDIFLPVETRDLQDAPWIAKVEWINEQTFRERWADEGWDDDWCEAVLKTPGRAFNFTNTMDWFLSATDIAYTIQETERNKNYYQIVHLHYKASNKAGVTGIYRTVLHASFPQDFGKHELLDYAHGKYPFVDLRRERTKKLMMSSRGIAEIVATDQQHIKAQIDSRMDNTSLSIRPPLIKPMNLAGNRVQDTIAPGGEIWERRAGTLRYFDPPRGDASGKSIEVEKALWERLDRRFGRFSPTVPAALTQMTYEVLVGDFFSDLTEAVRFTAQLVQQFMPDMAAQRVTGGTEAFGGNGQPQVFSASRDDIQGMYDFEMHFDTKELDIEWLSAKMKLLTELAIPLDTEAVVNRGELVRLIISMVDNRLATQVTKSTDQANQDETEDEQNAINAIVSGQEPVMKMGQNHALRLDYITKILQASPRLQKIVEGDQQVSETLKARMAFHNQQVTQEQNKLIGKRGAKSVLGMQPAA